jgi:Uma2 family endonuclease
MNAPVAMPLLTTEELLALPDDGVERWLIHGQLREKPMTVRNRQHSLIMARLTTLLTVWRDGQPEPRGQVLCGEAGCRLRRNPDSTVGIDVVYVSADVAARESGETSLIDGPPVLAVEILSPKDTQEELHEKVKDYLSAGVRAVWVVDPFDQTVRVYRSGAEPVLCNTAQELSGEPDLPGFRAPVALIFGR